MSHSTSYRVVAHGTGKATGDPLQFQVIGASLLIAVWLFVCWASVFLNHPGLRTIVLLGDSGTGKSHLLIGTCIAAAENGHRVRYVTCAQLANELAEAADDLHLSKTLAR